MTITATDNHGHWPTAAGIHQWEPTQHGPEYPAHGDRTTPVECSCGATASILTGPAGSEIASIREPSGGRVVLDEVHQGIVPGTYHLPNGALLWFSEPYEERVRLPDTPLLENGERPVWHITPPGFTFRTRIADADVEVEALQPELLEEDQADEADDEDAKWTPGRYRVTVRAHGMYSVHFEDYLWHDVRSFCRSTEAKLKENHERRHAG